MSERVCEACGDELTGRQRQFCSEACRSRARRGQIPVEVPDETGLASLIERKLAAAGRLDTVEGQQALLIARQLGAKVVNTSGMASLSREFSRVFTAAMAGVEEPKGDIVDELGAKRKALRRGRAAAV